VPVPESLLKLGRDMSTGLWTIELEKPVFAREGGRRTFAGLTLCPPVDMALLGGP
jgi:hypothetical protein